jgi:coenzyme F420 hydrogenase subunit beta
MEPTASLRKTGFEESLSANVVRAGKCLGCAACVVVCPFGCLVLSSEEPILAKECKPCGICSKVCPQLNWSLSEAEKTVFGRQRQDGEHFGIYRRLVVAQAGDSEVLRIGQDGGVVTALLLFALKSGIIDGAIVSGVSKDKHILPVPELATTAEEIRRVSGTRYFYSPNVLALGEAIKQKKKHVAFVGTPCQIRAVRKMQMAGLKKYTDSLTFLIGLMCSETFSYEGLMDKHLAGTLSLNLKDISGMNIKGKMLVTTKSGIQTIPLAAVKQYARSKCGFCDDFSSELADISVGGLGLNKWTFSIIRTQKGEDIFSDAEKAGAIKSRGVDEEVNALNLLRKLSEKKQQNVASRFTMQGSKGN